jgi:phage major head subunit gpT-like protein
MALTGRIIKTLLQDAYDRRIKTAYRQGYGDPEHEFEDFYTSQDIGTEDERWAQFTGFPQWQRKLLGDNVAYASISQGYEVTITPAEYSLAFTIEQSTEEDDQHGLLGTNLSSALAESGKETWETLAAAPFNNPTSTSAFSPWQTSTSATASGSSPDGVALLSTLHPIVTGGVYPNTPASQCSLSLSALSASKLRLRRMQGAHGQNWALQPESLVVPSDLEEITDQILGSEKVPFTADNTINSVRKGLTKKVWSRLTGTTSWYVFAKKAPKPGARGFGAVCLWRVRPSFDRDGEFNSGDRLYKGRARVGFGNWDWRGIDGSFGG